MEKVKKNVVAAVEKFCDELYYAYNPESEEDIRYYLEYINSELSKALEDLTFDMRVSVPYLEDEDAEFEKMIEEYELLEGARE